MPLRELHGQQVDSCAGPVSRMQVCCFLHIGSWFAETFNYLCTQVQSIQATQPAREHIVMNADPPPAQQASSCC